MLQYLQELKKGAVTIPHHDMISNQKWKHMFADTQ